MASSVFNEVSDSSSEIPIANIEIVDSEDGGSQFTNNNSYFVRSSAKVVSFLKKQMIMKAETLTSF